MNFAYYLHLPREFMISAAIGLASPAQADLSYGPDLSYILQPGSTITPWYNGHASGPSQPLTGTFTWHLFWVDHNFKAFDTTSLAFQSPSFRLTLDTTAANDVASATYPDSHTTSFVEVVDRIGLPGIPLQMFSTVDGPYEGPSESPTLLTYPGLFLSAPGGHIALLSFTATQVPEPTAMVLLIGGLSLLARRKLTRSLELTPVCAQVAGAATGWAQFNSHVRLFS